MNGSRTDQRYWQTYNMLQHAKHELLRRYLGGWFPKLASFSGRIVYVDCHAGRGRYKGGQAGSPLVALTTLLNHSHRDRILSGREVVFLFLELDREHAANLQREIDLLAPLPKAVRIDARQDDYERVLRDILEDLAARGERLAPSFFFLDPYGFLLPMDLLRGILSAAHTELLITFMYRYVDMAVFNDTQSENMDVLFGSGAWRRLRTIEDQGVRYDETIKLYATQLGAAYSTAMEMRGPHRERKYSLIHATNHKSGRELIKEAIWGLCPAGQFVVYQTQDPRQQQLILPEPDLRPLETELLLSFRGKRIDYDTVRAWLLPLVWQDCHLNTILRKLRKQHRITASGYEGRFAFRKNPTFHFPEA